MTKGGTLRLEWDSVNAETQQTQETYSNETTILQGARSAKRTHLENSQRGEPPMGEEKEQ